MCEASQIVSICGLGFLLDFGDSQLGFDWAPETEICASYGRYGRTSENYIDQPERTNCGH